MLKIILFWSIVCLVVE